MNDFSAVCFDREQAHVAAQRAYAHAQALLANGENALIECKPALEPITIQQRRFLHGPVLSQISEQVRLPDGTRYTSDVWKDYFRKIFLPDRWVLKAVPRWDPKVAALVQPKRATPHRERVSTEELGVRAYAELTEKIIAHATTEFAVVFHFTRDEELLRHRAQRARQST